MAPPLARRIRWLAPLALLLLLALLHPLWFAALGAFLIRTEEPFQAELVAVMSGDGFGYRLQRAAELVRQGHAPKVLVSGPAGFYGSHESDLAIAYAVKLGYPADWFVPLPNDADSSRQEATVILAEIARRNVRRFMVVTSNYHTRRTGFLFRFLAPGAELRVLAAPDPHFSPQTWWRTRRGRKLFVLEWEKTVADWLGM